MASLFKYDDLAWTEQVRERELRKRKGSEGVPREQVYVDESYEQESSEYNILRTAKDEEEDLERRQASTYRHTICRSAERRQHEADQLEEQRQLEERAAILKGSKTLQRSLERAHMNFKNQESLKVNPSSRPKLNSRLAVNLQNLACTTKSFNRRKHQFDPVPDSDARDTGQGTVVEAFLNKHCSGDRAMKKQEPIEQAHAGKVEAITSAEQAGAQGTRKASAYKSSRELREQMR